MVRSGAPNLQVVGAPGWPSPFSPSPFERKPARAQREDTQGMWRANSHLLPALGHGTGHGHARAERD
eukprot:1297154-Prymnesium_polylepis.1